MDLWFLFLNLVVDFWIILLVYGYYSLQGRFPWDYKIRSFNKRLTLKIMCINFFNIFSLALILELCFFVYQPVAWLETWSKSVELLIFGLFYTDIFSWIIHKAMHSPWFYKHIHSQHHEFYAPYALVAFYCHPVENLCFNLGNVVGPLFVYQPSFLLGKIWAFLALVNSVRAHAMEGSHDYHHRFLKVEFGTSVFMDRLFGTCYIPPTSLHRDQRESM